MTKPTPPLSIIQKAVLRRVTGLGLAAGSRVLDAPCGDGTLAAALSRNGLEAYGADLEASAEMLLGRRFLLADLNQGLPWPNGTFDAVLSVEGIEHLENRYLFLREARRILRPGGILIITTPNIVSLRSRVRFLGSGFYHRDSRPLNESQRHPLHHIGLTTFADLRYALHTSGFSLASVSATHVKPVSWPYSIFVPWMYLYTFAAFRKEKDVAQRERNRTIRRTLFSRALLFGENLLLTAVSPIHNREEEN